MESPLQNIGVLIADDTFTHQQMMQNVLRNLGFLNCSVSADGADAEQNYNSNSIDLVVSEIKLPQKSGIQLFETLIQAMKSDPDRKLKFLFFTAFGNEENIRSILKASEMCSPEEKKRLRFGVVLKPLRIDKLIPKLKDLFNEDEIIIKFLDNELKKHE
jgi:CheY-like chemotaxis protein